MPQTARSPETGAGCGVVFGPGGRVSSEALQHVPVAAQQSAHHCQGNHAHGAGRGFSSAAPVKYRNGEGIIKSNGLMKKQQ